MMFTRSLLAIGLLASSASGMKPLRFQARGIEGAKRQGQVAVMSAEDAIAKNAAEVQRQRDRYSAFLRAQREAAAANAHTSSTVNGNARLRWGGAQRLVQAANVISKRGEAQAPRSSGPQKPRRMPLAHSQPRGSSAHLSSGSSQSSSGTRRSPVPAHARNASKANALRSSGTPNTGEAAAPNLRALGKAAAGLLKARNAARERRAGRADAQTHGRTPSAVSSQSRGSSAGTSSRSSKPRSKDHGAARGRKQSGTSQSRSDTARPSGKSRSRRKATSSSPKKGKGGSKSKPKARERIRPGQTFFCNKDWESPNPVGYVEQRKKID